MAGRLDFTGQVVLVTGASSGIGRGCAEAFGAAGASVVVNHIGDPAADEVVRRIEGAGGKALAVRADVSSEAEVDDMFARAVARFGTVHVLVNNAGLQADSAFETMALAQWRKVIDVNLTGQFLCARGAVREFLRRGVDPAVSPAAGKIVCTSSVHQIIPWGGHANYAASKGGLKLLVETLAQEFAHRKIRVNAVAPGAIRTPINRPAWDTKAALDDLLHLIPYGRIGEVDDVANAVMWLASDESDYVTGATLVVDGGMVLYPGFGEGHG